MPETDAQWCLHAVQSAVTFERLIGLAAIFILDGSAEYKTEPEFADARKAFAEKIRELNIPDGDVRLDAVRDPVRAIDSYINDNWMGDWIIASRPTNHPRPDSNPIPPRANVSAVKAGSGASPNLLFPIQ